MKASRLRLGANKKDTQNGVSILKQVLKKLANPYRNATLRIHCEDL